MAIKKQLKDKDGNTIYPDVGLNLDYSTSEVNTGCKWYDRKPIYKKTISCGPLANAARKTVPHSITNFGSLVKAELRWFDTTDSRWFSGLRYDSSTVFVDFDSCDATNLYIKCQGTDWSSRTNNCYVTLYYTKTTD